MIKLTTKNKRSLKVFLVLFGITYLLITLFFFFIKDTGSSYSLTQTWKSYYGLDDWNLSKHAIVDLDEDGQKDIVTYTGCAFLSSVRLEDIPKDRRCMEPDMSVVAFPENHDMIGQRLLQTPLGNQLFRKTYLVKTRDNLWKYYEILPFSVHTAVLSPKQMFIQTSPTFFDRIDALYYQTTHFGIGIVLLFIH